MQTLVSVKRRKQTQNSRNIFQRSNTNFRDGYFGDGWLKAWEFFTPGRRRSVSASSARITELRRTDGDAAEMRI